MRVLVTGVYGFIGSYFVKWLLYNYPAINVIGFARNTDSRNHRRLEHLESHRNFQMIHGDVASPQISGLCEDVDYVVNFAAKTFVDHALKDSVPFVHSNILGAHNLMNDASRYKVKKFLQVSTDEVYGEILEGKYFENAPLNPRNPYAWTKAAADLDAMWRFHTYGFPVIITRTENNYGPYQHRQKVIPTFVRKALLKERLPIYGDGKHVRCWLHVEDHCRAIWHLLQFGKVGEIYHVAGEQELQNVELAKKVLRTLKFPENQLEFLDDHDIRPGHDRRYALAVNKIHDTGWIAKTPLESGLTQTILWYQDNGDWAL